MNGLGSIMVKKDNKMHKLVSGCVRSHKYDSNGNNLIEYLITRNFVSSQ